MPLNVDSTLALANRFAVHIESYDLGSWTQVQGLDVQWKMAEYRAGDAGNDRWFFPGFTEYTPIKLTRAACSESAVVRKWLSSNSFKMKAQTGNIVLMDPSNQPVVEWNLRRLIPVKWSIAGFEAGQSKVALETLELQHLGFLDDDQA
ncbi:phage tail protein [Streptomyces sp. NBC_01264]|uniref:phage tail protein n=1 Tax=Streptomyces sp. NBC_01264 TaxID=2903804 RepID=UPI002252C24A|nr:phage tail protein [Streptomyces sp. NBC_01264]MCX4781780.1 phage tail protein [Streptomyces sp. NBC_01264]